MSEETGEVEGEEEAEVILKSGHKKISRSTIESMIGADLRAVAHDRGYDIGQGGTRTSRLRFIAAQNADEPDPATDEEE